MQYEMPETDWAVTVNAWPTKGWVGFIFVTK